MKKLIILTFGICLLLLSRPMFSQKTSYLPMVDPERVWFETYSNGIPSPWGYNSSGHKYLNGDTVINAMTYQKIYHEQLNVWCTDIIIGYPIYCGAIREDAIQKKAWVVPSYYNDEILYFDFSLNAGDTIFMGETWFTTNCSMVDLIVSAIDTINTINGIERKRWLFDMNPFQDESYVIEGIGYSSGLLDCYEESFEYNNFLINVSIDTNLIYCSNFNGCYLPTDTCTTVAIEPKPTASSITIYPNPVVAGNPIRISGIPMNNNEPFIADVYDITGRKVMSFILKESDFTVPTPNRPGFYVINFYNSSFTKQLKINVL
jgi:hypothetical protein